MGQQGVTAIQQSLLMSVWIPIVDLLHWNVPNNTVINLNSPLASSRADFAEVLGRTLTLSKRSKYYYASVRTRYVVLLLMNSVVVEKQHSVLLIWTLSNGLLATAVM